jgi:hypothetical protein
MHKTATVLANVAAADVTARNQNEQSIGRNDDIDSYSIGEFCRRNSISRGTYYNMKEAGSGPREKRAMGRVLITWESAQAWRLTG